MEIIREELFSLINLFINADNKILLEEGVDYDPEANYKYIGLKYVTNDPLLNYFFARIESSESTVQCPNVFSGKNTFDELDQYITDISNILDNKLNRTGIYDCDEGMIISNNHLNKKNGFMRSYVSKDSYCTNDKEIFELFENIFTRKPVEEDGISLHCLPSFTIIAMLPPDGREDIMIFDLDNEYKVSIATAIKRSYVNFRYRFVCEEEAIYRIFCALFEEKPSLVTYEEDDDEFDLGDVISIIRKIIESGSSTTFYEKIQNLNPRDKTHNKYEIKKNFFINQSGNTKNSTYLVENISKLLSLSVGNIIGLLSNAYLKSNSFYNLDTNKIIQPSTASHKKFINFHFMLVSDNQSIFNKVIDILYSVGWVYFNEQEDIEEERPIKSITNNKIKQNRNMGGDISTNKENSSSLAIFSFTEQYSPNIKLNLPVALVEKDREKYINLDNGRLIQKASTRKKHYINHKFKFACDDISKYGAVMKYLKNEGLLSNNDDSIDLTDEMDKLTISPNTKKKEDSIKDETPKTHKYNLREKRKTIPTRVRYEVWKVYCGNSLEGHCFCCKKEIEYSTWECGHIKPAAEGGPDTIDNLRPTCLPCNRGMGTMNMLDYMKKYGFK